VSPPYVLAWCPACKVERCDYEVTADGAQHLDECPNCGSTEVPTCHGCDGAHGWWEGPVGARTWVVCPTCHSLDAHLDGAEDICWSCYRPQRRKAWLWCGECGHGYSRVGLVWADWRVSVALRRRFDFTDELGTHWTLRDRVKAVLPRRPSRIWACPCCVHDL
jgi:hypothetical protein